MNRMDGYNNGDGIEDSPGLDKRKVIGISYYFPRVVKLKIILA